MKVFELEKGKIYKNQYNDKYRISEKGELEFLDRDDKETWCILIIKYKELIEYEFTEYKETVDWNSIEIGTKVRCRDSGREIWNYGYFVGIILDKPFIMFRRTYEMSKDTSHSFNCIELYEWEGKV